MFSSWKIYVREKILLKKYLKESNMDEDLAYSPTTTQRRRLFESTRAKESVFTNSNISGFSSELSKTFNTAGYSSPDLFDKTSRHKDSRENEQ
jgi:hypothetical protein